MTGSSRLIVEYAGSWALVAAGARSERPGLLRSFHQRSREDRSWLLTPYRPSETRRDDTVSAASYGLLGCVDGMTRAAQAAPSAHPLRQAPSSLRTPL